MDPTRLYDYLEKSRARILEKVRPLTTDQYTRQFPLGLGSLARTLTHVMMSEWYYVQRMQGREVPHYTQWPIQDEKPPAFGVIDARWPAISALDASGSWDRPMEYTYTNDDGQRMISTATARDQFTQLVLHEVHHRAQAMNMLRQLGAPITEDLDFNAMMFSRRVAQ
jgi:uncharacterized damage-inducible protein DinB